MPITKFNSCVYMPSLNKSGVKFGIQLKRVGLVAWFRCSHEKLAVRVRGGRTKHNVYRHEFNRRCRLTGLALDFRFGMVPGSFQR